MDDIADRYLLDGQGRFVIRDYNRAPPFSSFLPGIGGRWGIPLWAFYVNRAQAMASFGAGDKNGQIMEFQSFNLACQRIRNEGFRTFLRLEGGTTVEPFQPGSEADQTMMASAGEVELAERNDPAGLEIRVAYYPLVNTPVAGLVRRVTVTNLSDRRRRIECLDGMARVLPYGMTNEHVKHTARHIEAMMGTVVGPGRALFTLDQTADDRERVERLSGAHFYLTGEDEPLVDSMLIFGDPFDLGFPREFARRGLAGLKGRTQQTEGRTPCCFTGFDRELAPGEHRTLSAVIGFSPDPERLERLSREVGPDFFERKRAENREVVEAIQSVAWTASADQRFDLYCRQTFLDNVLRGGLPHFFEGRTSPFYIYFRQNGDLERDYHHFVLEPTYLSQGTGHYRSILQNRRCDTWFSPEVADFNLRTFVDLVQTDGYNPLVIEGQRYRLPGPGSEERRVPDRVGALVDPNGFTPGELAMALDEEGMGRTEIDRTIGSVISASRPLEVGGLHGGFWIDHWAYNLDTLEVYAMVFPDRLAEILLEGGYTFFDNPDVVVPIRDKCVRRPDGAIRRYGAVVRDEEKERLIGSRVEDRHKVRTERGDVFETSLLVKLLCLVVNRMATLDPEGLGIEMEADKPGWNDSLNGLPALFGSSLCETFQLHRACRLLRDVLPALAVDGIDLYEELADFLEGLRNLLGAEGPDCFSYWRQSNLLKERYRERTRLGVTGRERFVSRRDLSDFLDSSLERLEGATADRERVFSPEGVPYTYFTYEVVEHRATDRLGHQGFELVEPLEFRRRAAPLFLEGPVHYLRLARDVSDARRIHQAVRRSPLFDEELGMYKSSEEVPEDAYEFGRAVGAYPRGWIENESIYVHMEYKYLLELLRSGLHEEFWRDARSALIPFLSPERYGRSVLEGVSFIASSAHPDPEVHGRGFQPRLSGVTAEMLNMWMLIVAGSKPFEIDASGDLRLTLRPIIPGWLFTSEERLLRFPYGDDRWEEILLQPNSFAFRFLGRTLVTYSNPARRATYGEEPARPVRYVTTDRLGHREAAEGPHLPDRIARAVRAGEIERIEVGLSIT